jgi:bifunctional non-homologous end joining protein LigD
LPARRFDEKPIDPVEIPAGVNEVTLDVGGRDVRLTNLDKVFWPGLGLTKRDLLQYYSNISPVLLPHIHDRAMVMKRFPHGIEGEHFFMKRTPTPRPDWLETCSVVHNPKNTIEFPVIQDLPSLLWVVNLGCIDLNQWYARCDDVDTPDYLHFDLDPTPGATFADIRRSALLVRDALGEMGIPSHVKTTGSDGIHLYVPIVRGTQQKQVWTFAKKFAHDVAAQHPDLLTPEYAIADRPDNHVLVDYNQNAWGRTLASVYSVRPNPKAMVSTPLRWDEVDDGAEPSDFTMMNVVERVRNVGDLWSPMLPSNGDRVDLGTFV